MHEDRDLRRIRLLTRALAVLVVAALAGLSLTLAKDAFAGGGIGAGDPDDGRPGGGASTLMGVSPSYAKFSHRVADKTGLSLRVVGAWSLAEGGPKDNPLNIGPGRRYGTVNKGARATTQLLRTELYRKILRSTGGKDGPQIKAIANSSWCPGCRGYGKLLRSAYRSVKVR